MTIAPPPNEATPTQPLAASHVSQQVVQSELGSAPKHFASIARRLLAAAVVITVVSLLLSRWTRPTGPAALTASGTVEATEVNIASEITGRVVGVYAREGERVIAGQELVRIDDSLLTIQYRQGGPSEQAVLKAQIDKAVIRAPRDGTISRRSIQPGEVAVAGSTLLVLADLDDLELTIYLLQRDIGQVRVGQDVIVTTDSLPGMQIAGSVASIGTRAEYTPRNVQTQKDRLGLVFGVKVLVHSDGRLKAGMPVDARIVQ